VSAGAVENVAIKDDPELFYRTPDEKLERDGELTHEKPWEKFIGEPQILLLVHIWFPHYDFALVYDTFNPKYDTNTNNPHPSATAMASPATASGVPAKVDTNANNHHPSATAMASPATASGTPAVASSASSGPAPAPAGVVSGPASAPVDARTTAANLASVATTALDATVGNFKGVDITAAK
jgi:hypothetical protein